MAESPWPAQPQFKSDRMDYNDRVSANVDVYFPFRFTPHPLS